MKKSLLFSLVILILSISLFSKESINDGTEFWIGLPLVGREVNEAIRGDYPIAIWISSKVDTRATISDAETGTMVNVVIRANQITQVPYGDIVMNKESEVAKNFGIHVVGDDPISVTVYMSYMWSGEAFSVIPAAYAGLEYFTLNMYQDQLTQSGEIRPAQILIVSTEDNNNITYIPTATTVKGIIKGNKGTVKLMKGQTFLILAKAVTDMTHDVSTDLTGTSIKSSKPIVVISGHTKVAFPKYQPTFLGRNGGFMRNALIESMPSVEVLGTEYVSVPFKYSNRKRGVVQDDKGDLIRFVATEDGTIISQKRKDGSGMMQISPIMKKQQFYDIVNQEEAAYYSSNKKVLVGQYGKTWLDHLPVTKSGDDQPQNPSSNGQGQLIVLTPVDHWTDYAAWRSPYSIDDYIYITFETKYLNYLYIATGNDKPQKFSARYGNSIKPIVGTLYSYVTEAISAGDHYIFGEFLDSTKKEKAVFAAYAYGNWDRSKDGFAYGYPIGFNYSTPCDDSLVVKDSMYCGNIVGTADVTPKLSDCAFLFSLYPGELDNYDFSVDPGFMPGQSKAANFYLNIIDARKPAHSWIKAKTKSGINIYKEFDYKPELIDVSPKLVDYSNLQEKDSVCSLFFTVSNIGDTTVTVNRLKLRRNGPEFKLNEKSKQYPVTYPFTLKKGETKTVEVCASAPIFTKQTVWDSVIAELNCYETPLCRLQYRMETPTVIVDDADWGDAHIGTSSTRDVEIRNQSSVNAVLTGMNWPQADKVNFPRVDGFTFKDTVNHGEFVTPVNLHPLTSKTFTVYYQPTDVGIHKTRATFTGNTTVTKLYSDWVGNGYTAVEEQSDLQEEISPNPVVDFLEIDLTRWTPLAKWSPSVEIKIFNVLGEIQTTPSLRDTPPYQGVGKVRIDVSGLAHGMYFVRFGDRVGKFVKM